MIITVKPGKLKKVNQTFFKFISVSQEPLENTNGVSVFNMTELLPPADYFIKYNDGQMSKKKFLKKYKEYISTKNTNIEYSLLSLGMALKNRNPICLTANEKEYRIGYIKVLADYIGDLFGVEVKDLDESNELFDTELDSYSKKERKLLKKTDDELSKKKIKFRNKMIKNIGKYAISEMTETETYEKMDRKFALDQLALVLISNGAVQVDKKSNGFKNIKADQVKKTKPWITAIFTSAEEAKPIKKIIKSVFESHQLKFKEKSCKKMDTAEFLALYGEIYAKVTEYRAGGAE